MDHPLDDRKLGCHHWPLRHVQPVHAAVQLFASLFLQENLFRIHPSQNCKVQIHCTGMPEANSIRKSKTLPKCKAQIYMHRLSLCTGFMHKVPHANGNKMGSSLFCKGKSTLWSFRQT